MENSAQSDWEVRSLVQFLNTEGVTGSEIHRRLNNIYSAVNVMSLRHVHKWIKCLNAERSETHDNIHDERQTGRLPDSINDETIACVSTLLVEDHRFTISDIHREITEHYLM